MDTNHKGNLEDPEFCRIFLRVLSYPITSRQVKYLLMRFYFNMNSQQIAKWDGKNVSRQAINNQFKEVYKKLGVVLKKR